MARALKTAILLGDSLTEWGDFSPLSPLVEVINKGVSGDATMGILARADGVARLKPDYLFLEAGINDIFHHERVEDIMFRHRAIWAKVKRISPGTKLLVLTLAPLCEELLADASDLVNNRRVMTLNRELKKYAKEDLVETLDLYAAYVRENGDAGLTRDDTDDGVHLKPAAYRPWLRLLIKYLAAEDL
jgi:lysophospholipase L1-like esterase